MPDNFARDFALPGFKSSRGADERADAPADPIVRAFALAGFRSSPRTAADIEEASMALTAPKSVPVKPSTPAVSLPTKPSTPAAAKPKVSSALGQTLAQGVASGFDVTRKGRGVIGAIAAGGGGEFYISRDPIGDLVRMLMTHGHAGTVAVRVDGAERRIALGDRTAVTRLAAEWVFREPPGITAELALSERAG
jgi:hypothetical protein